MTATPTTSPVRVRYAPSPTGSPHIGNIRTALFNWLLARHTGGTFFVRIEDTDQNRLVPGAVDNIFGSLRWLGLDWDEGPDVGGDHGPYVQSERLDLYRKHADDLIASGHAYRCFCSSERLDEVRAAQTERKEPIRYDRHCRDLPAAESEARAAAGEPFVVRFKAPLDGTTTFDDLFRGNISFENATLDDHVLLKSDGWPTYQLANIIDDHLMGVTHVLRGDEWIPSTPKHVLEYAAFGWQPPRFGHFALILGKDRTKLSKRHGATDVLSYRKAGYLPEALVNFLSLLGWSPPEIAGREEKAEILSLDELVRVFDLDRIGVTPSVFDSEKLDWMNGYYIRQLPESTLAEHLVPYLVEAGVLPAAEPSAEQLAYLAAIVPLIRERIKRLDEAPEVVRFFFEDELDYGSGVLIPKGLDQNQTCEALVAARSRLLTIASFDHATLEAELRTLAAELKLKPGQLFGALRAAVTGSNVAPPLFETMAVLGPERTEKRVARAIAKLA
jgi:glutamyl-tRNA synthetase